MNLLKIAGVGLLAIIFLGSIWFNLPLSWKYHQEIKIGNTFAANLKKYKSNNNSLPDQNDWETLKKLNPIDDYETWWPEYQKIGSNSFTLTFIEGFDPPYLTYDSKTNTWKKE